MIRAGEPLPVNKSESFKPSAEQIASGGHPAWQWSKIFSPLSEMDNDGVLSSCAGQRQVNPSPDGFSSLPVLAAIKFLSSVLFKAAIVKNGGYGLFFGKTTL
jgi:hypothetical protein